MIASTNTINAIYTVLRKHTSKRQTDAIMKDLKEITGNKSFRDTVNGLIQLHHQTHSTEVVGYEDL
jgi:hypothetical protein